ncbi:MAG: quinone-dependent dihydroorotate dehydrogenase [Proteobacteria bacterium]|nr:quinone-dependent dihydroorotate dehydrogenase [Pseudomonadota bacterium]
MTPYHLIVRPLLFRLDPETAHRTVLRLGPFFRFWPVNVAARTLYHFDDPRLVTSVFGLQFSSPICFAAGMDKNAEAVELLSCFGCAGLEIGGITAKAQSGNDRPRVFRFPEAGALVNRMGNPNIGADAVIPNLQRMRSQPWLPWIGINIGKSTSTPLDEALVDYRYTFERVQDHCHYFVLNVSCPNVAEYSKLQDKVRLNELFAGLQEINHAGKPLVVKLAPDLTEAQIDDALECALEHRIAAVIATNTTTSREELPVAREYQGGLSGRPLFARALKTVRYVSSQLRGRIPVIGVGGISSAQDVLTMMKAGASLVQLYTALVYHGPGLVKQLKRDLVAMMERDGVKHISAYVGQNDTSAKC